MPDTSSPPSPSGRPARVALPPVASLLAALVIVAVARPLGFGTPAKSEAQGAADGPGATSHEAAEPGRGRAAEHPVDIPPRGWWDIARRVVDEIGEDRIVSVAGGVAFFWLLALFPAVGAFVALYGLVSDPATIGGHLSTLGDVLPSGAIDIVGDQVRRITSKGEGALSLAFFSGLGISLWSANAGMKAIFDALNVAYGEQEKRNIVVLNLWSLCFTFGALVFLALVMSVIVLIPVVLSFVGLGAMTEWVMWAGRWPALLLLTIVALTVLYRYGPSRRRARWAWLSPGAIFGALGWLALSMLFSWYVSHFGSYNETYGSLGAVIGFMTWMWLSAIVILVGAEISAETEHQTARDSTDGPPRPLGQRGARMADSIGPSR